MKKTISSFLIAGLSIFAFTASAQKMAHINLDSLLRSMPESDSARKVGQTHYQQLEAEVESMQKEYQTKVQDYQAHEKTYTDLIKNNKQQEIQEIGQRIQAFQSSAQSDLQRFNDSITRPIISKAKEAVKKVAKKGMYKYVFDTSSGVVLYAEDSDDIYALVAEELKIQPKKSGK
ncbi:MAG TPA: OmpH family outer membrane protein [Bacteroidia bacterium]|jgi:outer membrane protein|nr:OmpH family outer membrane protein [Bacteroidia bacterium]